MRSGPALLSGLALAAPLLAAAPGHGACRLALALGLDISSSVDAAEDALQRQGLAAALRAPEVAAAVFASAEPVALAVFEWSGRDQQDLVLDWTLLRAPEDLEAAAERIARSRRSYAEFPTAIGQALIFAAALFATAPPCLYRTLDLSGDGTHNDGPSPIAAYRLPLYREATVNALAITGASDGLVDYYTDTVLHGPGAFLEIADGFEDFARAMRRKLLREMGARMLGALE
ncbi:DUF1194 domain-containing protein [Oceaniglobus roseus]|uniref:DUF1194 domain-containing protein n=1 Tax=Oceaniglobus roseus TaxID=1737570 RepID=UPI003182E7E4